MKDSVAPRIADDPFYTEFIRELSRKVPDAPLFTTSAEGLFKAFIEALPAEHRQHYTCHACRRFVDTYGGLVTIDEHGTTRPALWHTSDVPGFFFAAVDALAKKVARARVTGVFLSPREVWGEPETGFWRHMSARNPRVFRETALKSAFQAMAEKKEDFKMLSRGLAEFPVAAVEQAEAILKADALTRGEKVLGVAQWLLALHGAHAAAGTKMPRENVIWRAVAEAPPGFAHVRSTMIGTLLEDIVAGKSFEDIRKSFAAKMDPLQYQRPTAPPSAGNIARAEKVVAELAAAGALQRRFAKVTECEALWTPTSGILVDKAPSTGVFAHLARKGAAIVAAVTDPIPTTWEKFRRAVLEDAVEIEYFVPPGVAAYGALVTAANPDAPPILQWDDPAKRNPVSWYFYAHKSLPARWNLTPREHRRVVAITLQPSMWNGGAEKFAHQGAAVFFLLENAEDVGHVRSGGFFPETLRAEFHEVRKTMEAYAQDAPIAGNKGPGLACGIAVQKGAPSEATFRVTTKSRTQIAYRVDRWD